MESFVGRKRGRQRKAASFYCSGVRDDGVTVVTTDRPVDRA